MKLKHISEPCIGFHRKQRGEQFVYTDHKNNLVTKERVLERFESLKIPPNWKDVWICAYENGHIQAFGYDDKGRKQYIYHDKWHEYRNELKFRKMVEFAHCLPSIRRQAFHDAHQDSWTKEKVLGLIILTLDECHIRIGNKFYKEENETYGLTTLRRRHLHFHECGLQFEYKAKSGKYRKVNVKNNKVVNLIKECSELPGYELFRYKNGRGYSEVHSQDVNDYLRSVCGEVHTAKEFRTWGGTTLAVEKVPFAEQLIQENKKLKFETTVVKLVAEELGNTQTICRNYYIHPKILECIKNEDKEALRYKEKNTPKFGLTSSEEKVLQIVS